MQKKTKQTKRYDEHLCEHGNKCVIQKFYAGLRPESNGKEKDGTERRRTPSYARQFPTKVEPWMRWISTGLPGLPKESWVPAKHAELLRFISRSTVPKKDGSKVNHPRWCSYSQARISKALGQGWSPRTVCTYLETLERAGLIEKRGNGQLGYRVARPEWACSFDENAANAWLDDEEMEVSNEGLLARAREFVHLYGKQSEALTEEVVKKLKDPTTRKPKPEKVPSVVEALCGTESEPLQASAKALSGLPVSGQTKPSQGGAKLPSQGAAKLPSQPSAKCTNTRTQHSDGHSDPDRYLKNTNPSGIGCHEISAGERNQSPQERDEEMQMKKHQVPPADFGGGPDSYYEFVAELNRQHPCEKRPGGGRCKTCPQCIGFLAAKASEFQGEDGQEKREA